MTISLVSLRGLLPGTRMPTRGFLDCLKEYEKEKNDD